MQRPDESPHTQLADDRVAVMRIVMRAGSSRFLAALDEHGVSMTTMKLVMILDAESELAISRVAGMLGLSAAATSRAVDDAVRRGLLLRRESEADRRIKLISLAAAGHELAELLVSARRAGAEEVIAQLDAAQASAISAALAPLLALEAAPEACPISTAKDKDR